MGLVTPQSILGHWKAQDQNSNCTGAFLPKAMAYGVTTERVQPSDPGILARLEEVSTGAGCSESIWHPRNNGFLGNSHVCVSGVHSQKSRH